MIEKISKCDGISKAQSCVMDFHEEIQLPINVICEELSILLELICALKIAVIFSYYIDKNGVPGTIHNGFIDLVMCKNKPQMHLEKNTAP